LGKHLLKQVQITGDRREWCHLTVDVTGRNNRCQLPADLRDHHRQINRSQHNLFPPTPAQQQHRVNHVRHPDGRLQNHVQIKTDLLVGRRRQGVFRQVGKALHMPHRSPQVMGGRIDKRFEFRAGEGKQMSLSSQLCAADGVFDHQA